jgi:hypothetical protein
MADLSLEVTINADKRSAETFGEQIAESLKKAMNKLGLGTVVGGLKTEGAESGGSFKGVLGTLAIIAGGVLGILSVLKIFEPIFKLLKLIMTLLFIPLIPILLPAIKMLANSAKGWAEINTRSMKGWEAIMSGELFSKAIENIESQFKELGTRIYNGLIQAWDYIKKAWEFIRDASTKVWKSVFVPIWNIIKSIGETIGDVLTKIYNVFVKAYNKIAGIFGAKQISSSGGSTTAANTGLGTSGKDVFGILYNYAFGGAVGKQLGGVIGENRMFGLHRGERVVSATERGPSSKPTNISISINNPQIRSNDDIKVLVREMDSYFKRELRRRVSYI